MDIPYQGCYGGIIDFMRLLLHGTVLLVPISHCAHKKESELEHLKHPEIVTFIDDTFTTGRGDLRRTRLPAALSLRPGATGVILLLRGWDNSCINDNTSVRYFYRSSPILAQI